MSQYTQREVSTFRVSQVSHLSSCSSCWMSCDCSRPLTDTLRARRSVVFGSGHVNDDRKLLDEFSLKPQKNHQHGSCDTAGMMSEPIWRSYQLTPASTAPSHSSRLCTSHERGAGQDRSLRTRQLTFGLCSDQSYRDRRDCKEALPPAGQDTVSRAS